MIQKIIRYNIVKQFLAMLPGIEKGTFTLVTPNGVTRVFEGKTPHPQATLILRDWDVIVNAAKRGDIGLGEDYIEGKWESPDIGNMCEFFLLNMHCFEEYAHGNDINRIIFRIANALRRNSKTQSKKNIAAHYDVGNDFYKLWLDDTMTYSSAIYDGTDDLKTAQEQKYSRILQRITQQNPSEKKILEIGCGWGGFAEQAARQQHDVTSLTISPSQLAFAHERMNNAGLMDKVKLKLQDYRDVSGTFDAIVSIEMFEAVGEGYWADYFKTIKERLKKDGSAVVQTITIEDSEFEGYRKRSDFIRQYTFPGGMLPSLTRFKEEAEKAGLMCQDVYNFGLDYARTLREWLVRFDENREAILAMGYSDDFIRSWRFYLSMCIGTFAASRTDVVQVELVHAA